jgi:hypothetical protein
MLALAYTTLPTTITAILSTIIDTQNHMFGGVEGGVHVVDSDDGGRRLNERSDPLILVLVLVLELAYVLALALRGDAAGLMRYERGVEAGGRERGGG